MELRKYREAAAAFDAYLEKGGEPSAAVYRERGLAHLKLGEHDEAIVDYTLALKAKPKDEDKALLYRSRGQEYLTINALQLALRDFEEALRLDPQNADAYLGRAHVWVTRGELHKAVADADEVVKSEPKEPRLWHGAARVYAQAAAQLQAEPGQALSYSHYRERAAVLPWRKYAPSCI